MLYNDLEHPEITWARKTGYPSFAQPKKYYCEVCGKDITDLDKYEDDRHKYLCEDCLLFYHKKDWWSD